jgi:hypothetical protein
MAMSKSRRSPFSDAYYNYEGHKRGGRAKSRHALGSTGGVKQQFAAVGKSASRRLDRKPRHKEAGGALTSPGAFDPPARWNLREPPPPGRGSFVGTGQAVSAREPPSGSKAEPEAMGGRK